MRPLDYAPRPAHLKWLLDSDPAIRWQVMRDLTDASPDAIAAERSRVATAGWRAQLLARQSPAGHWPGGRQWDLTTLYSLTALMDFGLDPNSKQAHKMIDRIEKRLVFKPLNNRPYLRGETEPCINGRILGIGAISRNQSTHSPNNSSVNNSKMVAGTVKRGPPYLRNARPAAALPSTPPFACWKDFSNTNAQAASQRLSPKPASAQKTICSSATCSARFAPAKSSTIAGCAFSFPTFWHYAVLRGLDYLRSTGIKPDRRVREA